MTLDRTAPFERTRVAIDQPVFDCLMVSLAVMVLDVLVDDSPKMAFA